MYLHIEVDKAFAVVGEEVLYTVTLENDENTTCQDICLIDELSEEMELIVNSLRVGEKMITGDLTQGIQLGRLESGEIKIVRFRACIRRIPPFNSLTNTMDIEYRGAHQKERTKVQSNTVITLVTDPCIFVESGGLLLSTNQQIVDLGEEITYTVTLINKGNTTATNIVISYLESVGMQIQTQDQNKVLMRIPTLGIGEKQVIHYKALCTHETPNFQIVHTVQLEYDFVLANRHSVHKRNISNVVYVDIETATFAPDLGGISKEVSTPYCTTEDELTYQVRLTNKGNRPAYAIHYRDWLPEGVEIIRGSLIINGKISHESELASEILIDQLAPEESLHLMYKAKVGQKIPSKNPINHKGILIYDYQVGNNSKTAKQEMPEVLTEVQAAILCNGYKEGSLIQLDRAYASIGDQTNGNMILYNKGNKVIEKVILRVKVPDVIVWEGKGWEVGQGEVSVEYRERIQPQTSCQIPFSFSINQIPKSNKLMLESEVCYWYPVQEQLVQKKEKLTQLRELEIQAAILSDQDDGIIKAVDKTIAQVGDMLNYTLWLTNTGNIEAERVIWQEALPVTLKLIDAEGLQEGIEVGSIKPGEQKILRYQAKIVAMEEDERINPQSVISYEYLVGKEKRTQQIVCERATTQIEMAQIEGMMLVDREYGTLEDRVIYTLQLKNNGNRSAYDLEVLLPEVAGCRWEHHVIYIDHLGQDMNYEQKVSLQIQHLAQDAKIAALMQVRYQFRMTTGEEVSRHYTAPYVELPVIAPQLKQLDGGIAKTVDKQIASKGEELTYRIRFKNTGNISADEVIVKEQLLEGIKLIPGTLEIDGKRSSQEVLGVPLVFQQVKPDSVHMITYKVQIIDLPQGEQVKTITQVMYNYHLEDQGQRCIKEEVYSEPTRVYDTKISTQQGTLTHEVNRQIADVGDRLAYGISIMNRGNAAAMAPYYQAILSEELIYLKESLVVDGVPRACEPSRIELPDISPNQECKINFEACVRDLPKEGICSAQGRLHYKVYKPEGDGTAIIETNTVVRTPIYTAGPLKQKDFQQVLDHQVALLGEYIEATYTLTNTGNKTMQNSKIKLEDGCSYLLSERPEGEAIGNIEPGDIRVVKMRLQVVDTPQEPYVGPVGEVVYVYETEEGKKESKKVSNESILKIQDTGLTKPGQVVLTGDLAYAEIGEIICYEGSLSNLGNTSALNITIKVAYCEALELITDSFTIEDAKGGIEAVKSLHIEKIQPNERVTIRFKAKVREIPIDEAVDVQLSIHYGHKDANQKLRMNTVHTNKVKTVIRSVQFGQNSFTKIIEKEIYTVGEKIQYQIKCINTGNIAAKDVRIRQHFPKGITILPETIKSQKGDRLRWFQSAEIVVGELLPQQESLVSFEAMVETLMIQPAWIDNTYLVYCSEVVPEVALREKILEPISKSLQIVAPCLAVQMDVEEKEVLLGQEVFIKARITNKGNAEARAIKWDQLLAPHMMLVPESVSINRIAYPHITELGEVMHTKLGAGENVTMSFRVKIMGVINEDEGEFIPRVAYEFELRGLPQRGSNEGNEIRMKVHRAQVKIEIVCHEAHQKIQIGETVNYKITLLNEGTVPVHQLIVYDELSKAMRFIGGFVSIKDKKIGIQNLEDGINIGDLDTGEKLEVYYKTLVLGYYGKYVTNKLSARYKFALKQSDSLQVGESDPVIHQMEMISPYLTKVTEKRTWVLPANLPDIREIEKLEVCVKEVGIRTVLKEAEQAEIMMQLQYDISYRSYEGGSSKVRFDQLLMHHVAYSTIRANKENPLTVEIEKRSITQINQRQVEVQLSLCIDL